MSGYIRAKVLDAVASAVSGSVRSVAKEIADGACELLNDEIPQVAERISNEMVYQINAKVDEKLAEKNKSLQSNNKNLKSIEQVNAFMNNTIIPKFKKFFKLIAEKCPDNADQKIEYFIEQYSINYQKLPSEEFTHYDNMIKEIQRAKYGIDYTNPNESNIKCIQLSSTDQSDPLNQEEVATKTEEQVATKTDESNQNNQTGASSSVSDKIEDVKKKGKGILSRGNDFLNRGKGILSRGKGILSGFRGGNKRKTTRKIKGKGKIQTRKRRTNKRRNKK
jgi:hypothetical protein